MSDPVVATTMFGPRENTMIPSVAALLELQVIDQQRLKLRKGREACLSKSDKAKAAWAAADESARAAQAEVDRHGALVRQYTADVQRCEATMAELRGKQPEAKTNKDYMDIINGIEQAKLEKVKREGSIKDLNARIATLQERADLANAKAAELKAQLDAAVGGSEAAAQPSAEEAALEAQYNARRADVEPAFLEVYERLARAGKPPLVRVDPRTRATPQGAVLSHNQIEQIRTGKLVVDRGSNAILYLDDAERSAAK